MESESSQISWADLQTSWKQDYLILWLWKRLIWFNWSNPQIVVLLLLVAVQRKPNEDVIAKITTLDFQTQRDIMYFIESGLGKVNSHTLMAGGFTSGGYSAREGKWTQVGYKVVGHDPVAACSISSVQRLVECVHSLVHRTSPAPVFSMQKWSREKPGMRLCLHTTGKGYWYTVLN